MYLEKSIDKLSEEELMDVKVQTESCVIHVIHYIYFIYYKGAWKSVVYYIIQEKSTPLPPNFFYSSSPQFCFFLSFETLVTSLPMEFQMTVFFKRYGCFLVPNTGFVRVLKTLEFQESDFKASKVLEIGFWSLKVLDFLSE